MNFRDGVLLTLNCSKWSGAKKLEPSDLGLSPEDIPDFMRLGKKLLIPENERNSFTQVENNARNFLDRWSFPFPVGGARFVPRAKLMDTAAHLEQYKALFQSTVLSFLDRYEQIKREMLQNYPLYADKLEPYYPARNLVERKFSFTWAVFEISDTSMSETTSQEVIEAYNRFKAELQEKFDAFLQDVVVDMRATVAESCENLSRRMINGDLVTANTLKSVKDTIEHFQELNFIGDRSIDAHLAELRQHMNGHDPKELAKDLRDNETLRRELGNIAHKIAEQASNLNDVSEVTGQYKRSLDLS